MPEFDSREEYENWKARNALKRFGKAELERSDREWAKGDADARKKRGGGRLWIAVLSVIVVLCIILYAYVSRQ